jgi:hypothetical protein
MLSIDGYLRSDASKELNMRHITFVSIIFSILALAGSFASAHPDFDFPYGHIRPFVTDGCTGFLEGPEARPNQWHHCCVAHDLKYWAGGSHAEKRAADRELHRCVAQTGIDIGRPYGAAIIADLMFAGVKVGGSAYLPTPWRWGFGWEAIRGYSPLSAREYEEVQELLPHRHAYLYRYSY